MMDVLITVKRHVDLAAGIAFLCLIVLVWTLHQNYQMDADVRINRQLIIDKTDAQTTLTLQYIERMTNRWDKLQTQNPDLKVPSNGEVKK